MKQVYLTMHRVWVDIIDECETFILARDIDGVMVYVLRDGQERVRHVD